MEEYAKTDERIRENARLQRGNRGAIFFFFLIEAGMFAWNTKKSTKFVPEFDISIKSAIMTPAKILSEIEMSWGNKCIINIAQRKYKCEEARETNLLTITKLHVYYGLQWQRPMFITYSLLNSWPQQNEPWRILIWKWLSNKSECGFYSPSDTRKAFGGKQDL